ncbi:MAG: serine/threonine-protein kinase [Acutalibacteraceae bacterium]|nr:serine/threonine-protein kinase [Acutalibacteraceae bacterium]
MNDFENIIAEQFAFVKALKNTEEKSAVVLRHKTLGTSVVKKTFVSDGRVYEMLGRISHPNLPKVYSVEKIGDKCTVFEEYIDGITVADVLSGGFYTLKGAKAVARGVCSALETLHSMNIIHRDIKPENVMIDSDGNVKLIDFDAARIYKCYRSLDTAFVGTAGFAAPEQYGINQTDPRSDIFSLGIFLNIMLTGEHPSKRLYDGRFRKVIEKCINVDPNKRYPSVTELTKEL